MTDSSHPLSASQRMTAGAARWLATAAVCLAPWLFGSAEAWSYLFIVIILFVALGFWLISMLLGPPVSSSPPVMLLPIALLGCFVALQTIPLGSALTEALNPRAAEMRINAQHSLDALPSFSPGIPKPIQKTLSVAPSGSRRSLWLYLSYAAVFLIFSTTITHWHQVREVSSVVLVCGFVLAMLSMLQALSDSSLMMWFYKPRHGGTFFGTFTNRNHAGALFNMLFGLSAGMLISATAVHGAEGLSLRERLLAFSTRHTSRILLMAFTSIIMAASVVMARSRGAALALLAGVTIYILLTTFAGRSNQRSHPRTSLSLLLILVIAGLWIGWTPLLTRLQTLTSVFGADITDSRITATQATLLVYGTFPLTGSGFGTFKHVFPLFQPNAISFGRWNHAHNDWAQLLAEGGILGATLVIITCLLWIRWLVRRWDQMIHRAQIYVLGLGIGIVTIIVHSFFDYSLHKPANAWMLAALCGLATAAAALSAKTGAATAVQRDQLGSSNSKHSLHYLRSPGLTVALMVTALLATSAIREFKGELEFSRFLYLARTTNESNTPTVRDENIVLEALSSANLIRRLDMDDADAYRDISTILFGWATDPSVNRVTRLSLAETAAATAHCAVMKAPTDFLAWIWLARIQALAGKWDPAEACLIHARSLRTDQAKITMFGASPQRQH